MGYDGYTQYLCEVGHTWNEFVYGDEYDECPYCGGQKVWRNSVDQTNGMYCDRLTHALDGVELEDLEAMSDAEIKAATRCTGCEWCEEGRIDGEVKLEVTQKTHIEECECCHTVRCVEPARHKIPEDKGRII